MGTQPYEGKPAALPEAPQLSGIAEADGEIVIASGIGGDIGDHLPPEAFPLAGGMDSDPTDPQPAQRRRQGTAAVRRQRLGDQIPARPAKTRPYRPAKFGRKSPSATSHRAPATAPPARAQRKAWPGASIMRRRSSGKFGNAPRTIAGTSPPVALAAFASRTD